MIFRVLPVGLARRVERGMHAFPVRQLKQLGDKGHLQHRFAAADGDPAFFAVPAPILSVTKRLFQQAFRVRHLGGWVVHLPGIRIVAELTAQRAPLQKDHIAHAGAVHETEALDGMHPAKRLRCGHGRCGR